MSTALETTARSAAGRIISALATRFRDLDLAEEAFADACLSAARSWTQGSEPGDPAAWLYRVAVRRALDEVRRRGVRLRLMPEPPDDPADPEDLLTEDANTIPDERLRLIFVCCHPAIAPNARAALTLRLVCGLSASEIANVVRSNGRGVDNSRPRASRTCSFLSRSTFKEERSNCSVVGAEKHWQYMGGLERA